MYGPGRIGGIARIVLESPDVRRLAEKCPGMGDPGRCSEGLFGLYVLVATRAAVGFSGIYVSPRSSCRSGFQTIVATQSS